MTKGQQQVVETVQICRTLSQRLRESPAIEGADVFSQQLEHHAVRLERLLNRLFVRSSGGPRYTQFCLDAVGAVATALTAAGEAAPQQNPTLRQAVAGLEAAVLALEQKCLPTGGIVIT